MPLKVVILCHVEPGTVVDRTIQYDFDHAEGISETLPRIAEFADRHGVPMGFLLTAISHRLADTDLHGHDVGIHLHPRDPTLEAHLDGSVPLDHDCLARYSEEGQRKLIAAALEVFEQGTGRRPRLFVSGRWSENAATVRLLVEAGFTHDGSVLPGLRSSCADWSRVPRLAQPYAPDAQDHQRRGSAPLTYIPVCQGLWGHHLTPETIRVLGPAYFRAALQEAQVGGAEVVHIFFHSPLALDLEAMETFGRVLDDLHGLPGIEFALPTSLRPSERARARPFPPAYFAHFDWTLMKSFAGRGELGRRLRGGVTVPHDPFY